MWASGFLSIFKQKNINPESFRKQIRTELIKRNILSSFSKNINVIDNEIDAIVLSNKEKDAQIQAYIFASHDKSKNSFTSMSHLRKLLNDCSNIKDNAYSKFATKSVLDSKFKSLDISIRSIIEDLMENQVSFVFEDNKSFKLVMLCKKTIQEISKNESDDVTNLLLNKKILQKGEKFFEDLRKKSYTRIVGR